MRLSGQPKLVAVAGNVGPALQLIFEFALNGLANRPAYNNLGVDAPILHIMD